MRTQKGAATRAYLNFANDRVFGKYSDVDAWIKWKRNAEENLGINLRGFFPNSSPGARISPQVPMRTDLVEYEQAYR